MFAQKSFKIFAKICQNISPLYFRQQYIKNVWKCPILKLLLFLYILVSIFCFFWKCPVCPIFSASRSEEQAKNQGCGSAFISSGSSILGWIPIRIRSGSRALMTKNWRKKIQLKIFLFVFGSKTTIYLSLGLHTERPSYRRSLQLSKEVIQHFKHELKKKKFYFCGSFLPSWIRIRIPNPDLDPQPC